LTLYPEINYANLLILLSDKKEKGEEIFKQVNNAGNTLLLDAIEKNNHRAVEKLLTLGANPNHTPDGKDAPIFTALSKHDTGLQSNIITMLIIGHKDFNPHIKDYMLRPLLDVVFESECGHYECENEDHDKCKERLLLACLLQGAREFSREIIPKGKELDSLIEDCINGKISLIINFDDDGIELEEAEA